MSKIIYTEHFHHLDLNQIIVEHMLDPLSPKALSEAQEIFRERIDEGQKDLYNLFGRLKHYLGDVENHKIHCFSNYLEYLQFLYYERPKGMVDPYLKQLEQKAEYSFLRKYKELNPKKGMKLLRGGFPGYIRKEGLFIEAVESKGGPSKKKKAALLICRRKDVDTAIKKIAYRLLEDEVRILSGEKSSRHHMIDDWFGLKLVTYSEKEALREAEEIYSSIGRRLCLYTHAETYQPRFKKGTREKLPGPTQRKGLDNHYHFGRGKDHLVQIKVVPMQNEYAQDEIPREIVVTDIVNMLVDEMEHLDYRYHQQQRRDEFLDLSDKLRKRYHEFVDRGNELQKLLPNPRPRILDPEKSF